MKRSRSILVLGSQGMLGHAVYGYLSACGWSIAGTQFTDPAAPWFLDATASPQTWRPLFAATACDYVINCIGILQHAINAADPASVGAAIRINALFPHLVAETAAAVGARVIHMSTDGVFAGGNTAPYLESDPPNCPDVYGRSKALGESGAANVLNIRCSIVGRDPFEHKGLLEWLLRQPDGAAVRGFRDQFWNGVTTRQFAQLCHEMIEQDAWDATLRLSRTHHFCPNPATTKYDLLCAWSEVTGKAVTILPAEDPVPNRSRILGTQFPCLSSLYSPRNQWRDILQELFESGA